MAAEIGSLEKKAADSKLPPLERKQALEKMARLFELSGDTWGAAEAWGKAALAVPGKTDHEDLLQSARCLVSVGEFDRADAALKPVFASSDRSLLIKARLLGALIETFRNGRVETLGALLSSPDFADYKPEMYYTIWKFSGDPAIRSRLLAEFPQSPEARIVRDDSMVNAAPAALWLLSGAGSVSGSAAADTAGGQPVPAVESVQDGGPSMLQTGLFSREENARSLAERLRKAGFDPVVAQKTINGKQHWAVGVKPGSDPSRTTLLLKDKGFESFPVY